MVMVFAAISFLALGATLDWCLTNGRLTDRSNQYYTTAAAAEAALGGSQTGATEGSEGVR